MRKIKTRNSFAPLLYFIKPYPFEIFVVIFFILLASGLEGVSIIVIFGLLNSLVSVGQVDPSVSSGKIMYFLNKITDFSPFENKFIFLALVVFFIITFKCIFDFLKRYYTCYISAKIWHNVQYQVFAKCLYGDYQFFLDNKEGEIVYRCYNEPSIMGITLQYSCEFFAEIIKLIVVLFVLFALSFKLSIVIVVFSCLFYLLINLIAKNVSYVLGKGRQESCVKQTVLLTELINGIKTIKIYLSERKLLEDYDKAMRRYFNLYVKDETWQALPPNLLELLAFVLLGALLLFLKGNKAGFSIDQLSIMGVYVYAFYRFMPSLKNLSAKRLSYSGNFAIIEDLYDFCQKQLKNIPDGNVRLNEFTDVIKFEDLSFDYHGRKKVLKKINLLIEKGKTTALVGKSGSGKTTIVNLILRLFAIKEGTITVDGIPLKDLRLDSWLSKIGYVSQETFVFNASIRENIIFGRAEDEDKLIEVARLANAHEFIMELPDKYETLVGDKGMKLSGGQRQRIAIARAMYENPDILIFDEATSSLDNLSERIIQGAIKRISRDHTVILVAHRLSTVINADKIIVLEEGQIAEEGTHLQLIERDGRYRTLYNKESVEEGVS